MQDSELKKILLETCPVSPGQEDRAWMALRDRLYPTAQARWMWSWLFYPTWRGLTVAALALLLIPVVGSFFGGSSISLATADSQSPGIYATSFYSRPAQAQVVWLNGMGPASDKPTYLDPTGPAKTAPPARDPNSL